MVGSEFVGVMVGSSNRNDWNLIRSNTRHNFHGSSGNLRLLGCSQKQAYA